jgi:serine protease AprX
MNISEPASLVILGVGIRSHELDQLRTYPNPFTTSTTLRFRLRTDQQIGVSVYDSRGLEVRRELIGHLSAGDHTIVFRRGQLEAGLYLFRLENKDGIGYSGHLIIQD